MLEIYLQQRLQELERKEVIENSRTSLPDNLFQWTGTKIAAIELGYAIYAAGVLNNGNADIKEIMTYIVCMTKDTAVLTVKERYELGNNINSQILAFAFGLSAQIERDLISQRTKEGLARRVAEGQKLGRAVGGKNSHYKLTGKESIITQMQLEGKSKAAICRKLRCNLWTLNEHLKRMQFNV